jgi:thiol-disulfide isomerase/thioredoxin
LRPAVLCLVAALAAGAPPGARCAGDRPLEEQLREHRGRIVVVNFWAAWCGPCRKELPLLARLQREYDTRDVRFVGASTDAPEDREKAAALLAKAGVAYPIVFGLSEEEMQRLGLGSLLPTTAVFDRDGSRAFRLVGEVTKAKLAERLEWLLGARAGRPPKELLVPAGVDAGDYVD